MATGPTAATTPTRRPQTQRNDGAAAPPEEPTLFDGVLRWLLLFIGMQFITHAIMGGRGVPETPPTTSSPIVPPSVTTDTTTLSTPVTPKRKPEGVTQPKTHMNSVWPINTPLSLSVYFSEDSTVSSPRRQPRSILGSWHESGLRFGQANERNDSVTIALSDNVWNNRTGVYAHVYLYRLGSMEEGAVTKGGSSRRSEVEDVLYKCVNMTKLRRRKKVKEVKNLLGQEDKSDTTPSDTPQSSLPDTTVLGRAAANKTTDVTLLYMKPTLTLQLVDFAGPVPRNSLPPQLVDVMDFPIDFENDGEMKREENKKRRNLMVASDGMDFYPILYPSEFWIKTHDLLPVNGTLESVTIDVKLTTVKFWKWQLMSSMETQWKTQDALSGDDTESDFIRSILHDTNPWLLALTGVVSLLHSIFDFLAFKNDISFFRKKKSMEGLSLRSMIVNTFFQVVIFLYLFDNETSFMVLISNGMGLAIEFWKISKAVNVTFTSQGKIVWKETDTSYATSRTKEYDEIATSHLLMATMPLVAGYGVYSLVHVKHKGYYSWILSTLVGFIYMFGFVMMTPQLFINYKLKSVAHLNWRTMSYKSINTFIDDLFAFVIKMPIMHRLACLRDDVVFFVFLYQRWIYKIDYSRINEFGQCEMPSEEMKKELEEDEKKEKAEAISNDGAMANTTEHVSKRRSAKDRKND